MYKIKMTCNKLQCTLADKKVFWTSKKNVSKLFNIQVWKKIIIIIIIIYLSEYTAFYRSNL